MPVVVVFFMRRDHANQVISFSVSDLTKISDQLLGILPKDRILTEAEDIIPYSFDGTATLSQRPAAVVLVTTTEEVSRLLKWANETRTPIIARGSGTGLAGGSVPLAGSVVMCMSRFDKVLE